MPLLRMDLRVSTFAGKNVWEGKLIGYALQASLYLIRLESSGPYVTIGHIFFPIGGV